MFSPSEPNPPLTLHPTRLCPEKDRQLFEMDDRIVFNNESTHTTIERSVYFEVIFLHVHPSTHVHTTTVMATMLYVTSRRPVKANANTAGDCTCSQWCRHTMLGR
jgi:hypothetical protein